MLKTNGVMIFQNHLFPWTVECCIILSTTQCIQDTINSFNCKNFHLCCDVTFCKSQRSNTSLESDQDDKTDPRFKNVMRTVVR